MNSGLKCDGDDRGDARLGVVFLRVDRHAAGADDLQRLERVALHDHVLRRPVGAGDRVLVLVALVLRRVDAARLEADADLGDVVRLLHPQVDHVDLGVAPDHEQVASGGRHARDVHRVAGLDDVDDLLGVAVDQRHLAGVAQRRREDVLDVVAVHLLRRALARRDDDLPRRLHLLHAEFRRRGRRLLDVARHQVHVGVGEIARRAPVRHAGRRAVLDEDLQVLGALVDRDVGRERLAGRALAQHAVAAGAALEVDLPRLVELGLRHRRRLRIDVLVHVDARERRAARLVRRFARRDFLVLRLRRLLRKCAADGKRQHGQREHSCGDSTIHFPLLWRGQRPAGTYPFVNPARSDGGECSADPWRSLIDLKD